MFSNGDVTIVPEVKGSRSCGQWVQEMENSHPTGAKVLDISFRFGKGADDGFSGTGEIVIHESAASDSKDAVTSLVSLMLASKIPSLWSTAVDGSGHAYYGTGTIFINNLPYSRDRLLDIGPLTYCYDYAGHVAAGLSRFRNNWLKDKDVSSEVTFI
jgi:hypothetical protein